MWHKPTEQRAGRPSSPKLGQDAATVLPLLQAQPGSFWGLPPPTGHRNPPRGHCRALPPPCTPGSGAAAAPARKPHANLNKGSD